jgi:DNA polymerase I-like protein with 3'-5' exonuclease and polymerase domains
MNAVSAIPSLPDFCRSNLFSRLEADYSSKKEHIDLEKIISVLLVNSIGIQIKSLSLVVIDDSQSQVANEYVAYLFDYFSRNSKSEKGQKNITLFSELLYSGLGLSPQAREVFEGYLSRAGLSMTDLTLSPSFTEDFYITDPEKMQEMETEDFNKITKVIAPLILMYMDRSVSPRVFVIPFDLKAVRDKCFSYFSSGKTPKSDRGSIFKYKQHFVVFLPDVDKVCDDSVEADKFHYAVVSIKNASDLLYSKSHTRFNSLPDMLLSDCDMFMPPYEDEKDYNDFLDAYFDTLISDTSLKFIACDTETAGLDPRADGAQLLTIQIATSHKDAIMLPFSSQYGVTDKSRSKIVDGFNELFKHKYVLYFNQAYEAKWFLHNGIIPRPQYHDAQMLFKDYNRNVTATLSNATKIMAPEIGGYSDVFDNSVDKSRMSEVPLEDMLPYACGDVIATYRVFYNLIQTAPKFENMYKIYQIKTKIQYYNALFLENVGHPVDVDYAKKLFEALNSAYMEQKTALVEDIPSDLKAELLIKGLTKNSKSNPSSTEGFKTSSMNKFGGEHYTLNIGSSTFKDRLFYSKEGFDLSGLLPPNVEPDLRTTGALFHLQDHHYVAMYVARQKLDKIISTYLGNMNDEEDSGGLVGKAHGNCIYSSYNLSHTTSGRSNSNPNLQNIPNKSVASKFIRLALSVPVLEEPYIFVANDYSQVEVRLMAILCKDEALLSIYREGKDVYAAVAAGLNDMTHEEFCALPKHEYKPLRQKAKAVVLGFMYGMFPKGFKDYAEKTFDVIFTLQEAKEYRDKFFNLYPNLRNYHEMIEKEGTKNGYALCPLGSVHTFFSATLNKHLNYHKKKNGAVRNLINSPIQGLGAFLTMWAAQRVLEGFISVGIESVYFINFVHDDDKYMMPKRLWKKYAAWIKWEMQNLPIKEIFGVEFPIPLTSSTEVGYNYAEMRELEGDEDIQEEMPPWAKNRVEFLAI